MNITPILGPLADALKSKKALALVVSLAVVGQLTYLGKIAGIWRDYYECTPGNPTLPGVTAYYPMHEGAGGTVADYMGGTSGTITGAAWVAGLAMPGG